MLQNNIINFLQYCNNLYFTQRSIESLTLRLTEFSITLPRKKQPPSDSEILSSSHCSAFSHRAPKRSSTSISATSTWLKAVIESRKKDSRDQQKKTCPCHRYCASSCLNIFSKLIKIRNPYYIKLTIV